MSTILVNCLDGHQPKSGMSSLKSPSQKVSSRSGGQKAGKTPSSFQHLPTPNLGYEVSEARDGYSRA